MIKNKKKTLEDLSTKEKDFFYNLVSRSYFLGALDSYYDEGDEEEFKKEYKITFKQAEEAQKKLINILSRA
jgi:hypothetical protein